MRLRATLALCLLAALAFATDKKPLDHADYARWSSVRGATLSRDGKWLAYVQTPYEADGVLHVKQTQGDKAYTVERASGQRFTSDGKFVIALVSPAKAEAEKARKSKQPVPKNKVAILNLGTGTVSSIEATSFQMPEENETWCVLQFEAVAGKKGYPIEVRIPAMGGIARIEGVSEYVLSKDGRGMAVSFAEKDGLVWIEEPTGKRTPIEADKGKYSRLTISPKTGDVACYFEPATDGKDKPVPTIRVWVKASAKVETVPVGDLPKDRPIATRAALRFSEDGQRLFFGTAPPTTPDPKPVEPPGDDVVTLDVWHWKDPQIQPEQLLRAAADRARTFEAVWNLRSKRVLQLETDDLTISAAFGRSGAGDFVIGSDSRAYEVQTTWDRDYRDVYAVDLNSGKRRPLATKLYRPVSLSTGGRYAVWYDDTSRGYLATDLTKQDGPKTITAGIPTQLWSDETDVPGEPAPFGLVGWTVGDKELLVYDRYDIWAVDPAGKAKARCVTNGFGRTWKIVLRRLVLEPEEGGISAAAPLFLSATDDVTKANGFYAGSISGGTPLRLRMEDRAFGDLTKAKDANVVVLTRQSFQEYPDLYVTDTSLRVLKRMSDANPQQAEYLWGNDELVEWTSADGEQLKGILVKPADFDPTKKYPMITYFYERLSSSLHRYTVPAPVSGGSANASFLASRGYLVFKPDVTYAVGYPGRSALSAIVPGVLALVKRGFVDPERIGMVGHSWGGYQTAYLVTQTNLFRCAVAGAAVSNMTSAYDGIRWGSGKMRQFQYEIGQSRIGGSIWQNPLQYIDNSPIFWVDRVTTPLLMVHNDKDGAVPWEQGIEMYGALRRLGKPVWLLNYNGEDHGLGKAVNRKDWTIRLNQFFDHYLKGAPAPTWLADGIPASQKGKALGLDLKGK